MKKLKIIIPIILAGILVIAGIRLIKLRKEADLKLKPATVYPIVVTTVKPKYEEAILTLPYIGLVKNDKEVLISSKFAGKIIYEKELGEKVKKGESVLKIDDTALKAKLKTIDENINTLYNKLNALNVSLKTLLNTHKRTEELLKVKMASIEQYENEKSKIASLKAEIKATKNSIRIQQQNKKSILNDLAYTDIKSPIDGIISAKMSNIGDNATPLKPVLKISPKNGNYILLALNFKPEGIIYKNKEYDVIPLKNTLNSLQTYKAKIDDEKLINGEKVKLDIITFKGKATLLPYDAILSINGENYIFIPKNNTAEIKKVTVLAQGKNEVAIKEKITSPVIKAEADLLLRIKAGYPIKVKGI